MYLDLLVIPKGDHRQGLGGHTCDFSLLFVSRVGLAPSNVGFGSLADIRARIGDVRFTPKSGRAGEPLKSPLSATSSRLSAQAFRPAPSTSTRLTKAPSSTTPSLPSWWPRPCGGQLQYRAFSRARTSHSCILRIVGPSDLCEKGQRLLWVFWRPLAPPCLCVGRFASVASRLKRSLNLFTTKSDRGPDSAPAVEPGCEEHPRSIASQSWRL